MNNVDLGGKLAASVPLGTRVSKRVCELVIGDTEQQQRPDSRLLRLTQRVEYEILRTVKKNNLSPSTCQFQKGPASDIHNATWLS